MKLTATEQRIVHIIQAQFPLTIHPYRAIGELVDQSEETVIDTLKSLKARNLLRQISAIFHGKYLGFDTALVSFQVEEPQLEQAAGIVSGHPGVSHNYQREHPYNLWFTLAVPHELNIERHVHALVRLTSCSRFLYLPGVKTFKRRVHFDVQPVETRTPFAPPCPPFKGRFFMFALGTRASIPLLGGVRGGFECPMQRQTLLPTPCPSQEGNTRLRRKKPTLVSLCPLPGGEYDGRSPEEVFFPGGEYEGGSPEEIPLLGGGRGGSKKSEALQRNVMRELQQDLPLSPTPFLDIARKFDIEPDSLFDFLAYLKASKKMNRFAGIVRHRHLGFTSNVMVVWNIPAEQVDEFGQYASEKPDISHCYERVTYPEWPYNLYTMIHGTSRQDNQQCIEELAETFSLDDYQTLYSGREFKKQRVDYFSNAIHEWHQDYVKNYE